MQNIQTNGPQPNWDVKEVITNVLHFSKLKSGEVFDEKFFEVLSERL